MGKAIQNIYKMFLTMTISGIIICFGKDELFRNICLGIFASAFIAFICFFTDYFYEKRKTHEKIIENYVYFRNHYLIKFGEETIQTINQYYQNGDHNKLMSLMSDYKPFSTRLTKLKRDEHARLLGVLLNINSYFIMRVHFYDMLKYYSDGNKLYVSASNEAKLRNKNYKEIPVYYDSSSSNEFIVELSSSQKALLECLENISKSYDDNIAEFEENFSEAVKKEQDLCNEMIEQRKKILNENVIIEAWLGIKSIF